MSAQDQDQQQQAAATTQAVSAKSDSAVIETKESAPAASTASSSNATEGKEASNVATAAEPVTANTATAEGQVPFYKVGEDVSSITGRPRITPEENQALKGGAIFRKAMHTVANARGEDYEPYRLPAHMRAALAQIDRESEQERLAEASKEGKSVAESELTSAAFAQMHSVNPEEEEQSRKAMSEEERIKAGGARFYGKYQQLVEGQSQRYEDNKSKIKRNLKIALIAVIGLIGYVGYNQFFNDPQANSIAELKAALPLSIDAYTSMVRIDDRNNEFKIFFEKDPAAYAGMSAQERDAMLGTFAYNAPLLCKNSLLRSIIKSGRKVTVLLEATDRSFFREISIDQCPVDGQGAAGAPQNAQ